MKHNRSERPVSWWHRADAIHAGESGSVMILVMGVLAVSIVMIAHIVVVSNMIAKESAQVSGSESIRYQAESAADTAYWMHLNDRRLFSDRTLGNDPYNDEFRDSADYPPWMLDGRPHEFDDGECLVFMNSAENGFKAGQPDDLKSNVDIDDTDQMDLVEDFLDVLADYVDGDDLTHLNGMEYEDFSAEGYETLPRNGSLEFKAELYWLPGWRDAISGEICIVPPNGVSYSFSRNPSFFSASDQELSTRLDLQEGDLEAIHEARRLWEDEGIELSESLSADLLLEIKEKFTFSEAGLGQIIAIVSRGEGAGYLEYRVTRECNLSSKTVFADKDKQTLSIWERIIR